MNTSGVACNASDLFHVGPPLFVTKRLAPECVAQAIDARHMSDSSVDRSNARGLEVILVRVPPSLLPLLLLCLFSNDALWSPPVRVRETSGGDFGGDILVHALQNGRSQCQDQSPFHST